MHARNTEIQKADEGRAAQEGGLHACNQLVEMGIPGKEEVRAMRLQSNRYVSKSNIVLYIDSIHAEKLMCYHVQMAKVAMMIFEEAVIQHEHIDKSLRCLLPS